MFNYFVFVYSDAERRRLLHFVVCGGGPTSVEFSAELYDFLVTDVRRWFPDMAKYVQITLIEASNVLLGSFKKALQSFAMSLFKRRNIEVLVKAKVTEIHEQYLTIEIEGKNWFCFDLVRCKNLKMK